MMHLLVSCVFAAAAGPNLLTNPNFGEAMTGWEVQAESAEVARAAPEGPLALHLSVPPEKLVGYPRVLQRFTCAPEAVYEARVLAKGVDVRDGYGAYMTLEFVDGAGKRINFFQGSAAEPDGTWSEIVVRGVAPPEAAKSMICCVLNGHGNAWFREASVTLLEAPGPVAERDAVTLTVTDQRPCARFLGFGFEDDGWLYNPMNAEHGVDAAGLALYEERVRWMDPDWVRMFFWYKDWNPSGDWATFTWDDPNMLSHYRALDLYQAIGAAVNVTGVEWGVETPFSAPEALAAAVGALLEHLIRDKGYTCVKYWTLTNEPNGHFVRTGATFDDFVKLHRLVKAEIQRRGLGVAVVGSDDTNGGDPWFKHCVEDSTYFETADIFASHRYLPFTARALMPSFIQDRLDLLAGRKPFVVAEFGFQDERSGTLENPLMEEYPYAVWTASFAIRGLNLGVSGFSIWCLNEMYYPGGGFMNYGLWNYANRGWALRPVFHAWSQFTRRTEAGDVVLRTESSAPRLASGVVVGKTLFFVNESLHPIRITVDGKAVAEVAQLDVFSDLGKMDTVAPVAVEGNVFEAKAQSFGWCALRE